ncbi:MAG: HEAT repeat domain-containing protein [Sandaracinus sp.]
MSTDEGERVEALRARIRTEHGSAHPLDPNLLATVLADADWRVRKDAAALAASHMADRGVIDTVVDGVLSPDDVGLRNAAIEACVLTAKTSVAALVESALVRALETAMPTARKFVCAALACGGEAALRVLSALAVDPDATTATAALEAISHIGGPRAEAILARALGSSEPLARLAAIEGLVALGARRPLDEIVALAQDPLLSRRAMLLAGLTGDPGAIPILVGRIAARANVAEAVTALARLHEAPGGASVVAAAMEGLDRRALAPMRRLLDGSDPHVSRAAALLLLLARDEGALARIAILAGDIELGPAVLEGLRAFGAAAVPPLLAALPGLDPRAHAFALEAAADLATLDASALAAPIRRALREALASRDETTLLAAVRGLASWAEPDDAPALVALGNHASATIAQAASETVAQLGRTAKDAVSVAVVAARSDEATAWGSATFTLPPDVAIEKLRVALSEADPRTRRAAVTALADVQDLQAAELAAMALADEDADVRVSAIRTLAARSDVAGRALAESRIALELRSELSPVRAEACRALSRLDARGRADAILRLVEDPSSEVRIAALTTLVHWEDPRGVAALPAALENPDPEVVKAAVTLARARPSLVPPLRSLLAHPAWDVRHAAVLALATIDRASVIAHRERETDGLVRAAIDEVLAAPSDRGGA